MEGLSADSTPTTEYRLSSFSNCSSPPVNDESSYGSSFLRVSSQDNCKEAGDMIESATCLCKLTLPRSFWHLRTMPYEEASVEPAQLLAIRCTASLPHHWAIRPSM